MNYEQKYNDTLDLARTFYEGYIIQGHDDEAGILAEIFPELKESKDARIRKQLLNWFKTAHWDAIEKGKLKRDDIIAWFEKQGEKPTGKIEPKFKVGDWITDGYVGGLITSIEDNYPCYKIADFMGGINTSIPLTLQDNYHLWTIEDAKDGDILACNKEILLFKSASALGHISLHCWYNGQTNHFHSKAVYDTLMITRNKICPATKEQQDLFIQKMKEAGYKWDSVKKELKKIEVASKEGKDEREELILYLKGIRFTTVEGAEQVRNWLTWLEKQGEQKQTWTPSAAQLIVIKDLIEDKNTSNVNKTILRGMFDEFKQFLSPNSNTKANKL